MSTPRGILSKHTVKGFLDLVAGKASFLKVFRCKFQSGGEGYSCLVFPFFVLCFIKQILRNSHKFEVSSKASQGACVPPALPPLRTCDGQIITVQALHLKVGSGISRTNADSQRNPVYNAFHRNF